MRKNKSQRRSGDHFDGEGLLHPLAQQIATAYPHGNSGPSKLIFGARTVRAESHPLGGAALPVRVAEAATRLAPGIPKACKLLHQRNPVHNADPVCGSE